MPRYRMKYSKAELARFIGHLDTMKNFERAFRRANLPLAFSQGFNPHPKISFASPLAVGVTGEEEYVDFYLREEMQTSEILEAIREVMPTGFEVIEIKEVDEGLPALMAQIGLARYRIEAPLKKDIQPNCLTEEIQKLLSQSEIKVNRETKNGLKKKDIKNGIHSINPRIENNKVIFETLLDSGSSNNIRPEEILKATEAYTQIPIDLTVSRIHRSGVFIKKDNEIISPMAD